MLDLGHRSTFQFEVRNGRGQGNRIDQYTQEADRQPMEVRLPFIPRTRYSCSYDMKRARGIGEENDPREICFSSFTVLILLLLCGLSVI